MSTTTTLCTGTSAPSADDPSPRSTCWTSTSWSGMTPCSRSCPKGRTCISAWWKAVQRSSRPAKTGRITWCGVTSTLPTSDSINQRKAKAQPRPGPPYRGQQKLWGMTGSSREGTPWKSALNTRPPSQSPWPNGGPTATEYLLPSASVKGRREDLKAARKKRISSDHVVRKPQASKQTPRGAGDLHRTPCQ